MQGSRLIVPARAPLCCALAGAAQLRTAKYWPNVNLHHSFRSGLQRALHTRAAPLCPPQLRMTLSFALLVPIPVGARRICLECSKKTAPVG